MPSVQEETTAAPPAQVQTVEEAPLPEGFLPNPLPEKLDGWDWIKLVSGEWLKGEAISLSRDNLEFDSDELGDLLFDWDKIDEVVTETPFTLHLTDRTIVVGQPRVKGDQITLRSPNGDMQLTRAEVMGFIHGRPTERNYWSGRLGFGATIQAGNTDQVDNTATVKATRRTAKSRLNLSINSVLGSVDGAETVNNQTLRSNYDVYLTPRFFVTPLGLELFRDPFQNIDFRAAPYAGVGYSLLNGKGSEWDVTTGLGYRSTRFDSVAAGESQSSETGTFVFESTYTQDITRALEVSFAYGAQIGLKDTTDTNQHAALSLIFEFAWGLDFTVNTVWKHVGMPAEDATNETPDADDLRIDIGFSWEF